jgi:hypothetical protein
MAMAEEEEQAGLIIIMRKKLVLAISLMADQ